MARALFTLLVGILLAVLLAALIAGDRDLLAVLGPVLVTTGIGVVVMAAVAWRARIRARAEQLQDSDASRGVRSTERAPDAPHEHTPRSAERTTDEDIDRG